MSLIQMADNFEKLSNANSRINEGDYQNKDDYDLWYCGKCHTRKQTRQIIFDRERRPMCLCECEKAKKDEEERQAKLQERVAELRDRAYAVYPYPIKNQILQKTFENDDNKNPELTEKMKLYVENFEAYKKKGIGLYLNGDTGRGKSYAAYEVANALLDKGYSVIVTDLASVLRDLQETFEKQAYIHNLCSPSLLVLDDFGVERDTSFAMEQIYSVIDSRYEANLPMIITSNLTSEALVNAKNIREKRIYERILEKCRMVEVKGINRRLTIAKGK